METKRLFKWIGVSLAVFVTLIAIICGQTDICRVPPSDCNSACIARDAVRGDCSSDANSYQCVSDNCYFNRYNLTDETGQKYECTVDDCWCAGNSVPCAPDCESNCTATGCQSLCVSDGCNGICPANCTVTQDPDCGCQDNDGCCGIGCNFQNDNDCPSESALKIAAFNIQIFGQAKIGKEDVMDVLKKIAQEFDIMLVQEIRDAKEETAPYYCQEINEAVGYQKYDFIRSERLGRSSSKEAYAYFYNTDRVQFIEGSAYVYNDVGDIFEREPYIASFRSGNFDFTLVGIHTKPDDADSEIAHLADVVNSILAEDPDEKDIIVMGDFNADGSYFDEDDNTNPFKSSEFYWVVTNDMDTMTKTGWTYDRMVMMDSTFNQEYVKNSAAVFYFDTEYGIDDEEFVWEVSDHYPIYANFKTNLTDDD